VPKPRIFTTHRHRYANDFWSLERRMRSAFVYDDMSVHEYKFDGYVPEGDLERTIDNRIYQCNVFIAIGRRATRNSDWCVWEIELARKYRKPIICYSPYAIDPREAPAAATEARSYIGYFTQVPVLVGWLDELGLDLWAP
jgi:hypothetical protein